MGLFRGWLEARRIRIWDRIWMKVYKSYRMSPLDFKLPIPRESGSFIGFLIAHRLGAGPGSLLRPKELVVDPTTNEPKQIPELLLVIIQSARKLKTYKDQPTAHRLYQRARELVTNPPEFYQQFRVDYDKARPAKIALAHFVAQIIYHAMLVRLGIQKPFRSAFGPGKTVSQWEQQLGHLSGEELKKKFKDLAGRYLLVSKKKGRFFANYYAKVLEDPLQILKDKLPHSQYLDTLLALFDSFVSSGQLSDTKSHEILLRIASGEKGLLSKEDLERFVPA